VEIWTGSTLSRHDAAIRCRMNYMTEDLCVCDVSRLELAILLFDIFYFYFYFCIYVHPEARQVLVVLVKRKGVVSGVLLCLPASLFFGL
jgi:hypothetical protein